jgi:hypothetical protein
MRIPRFKDVWKNSLKIWTSQRCSNEERRKKKFKVICDLSPSSLSLISLGICVYRISRIRDSGKVPECRSKTVVGWRGVAHYDEVKFYHPFGSQFSQSISLGMTTAK